MFTEFTGTFPKIIMMAIIMMIIMINNNNNETPWPGNTELTSGGGHNHVLRGDEPLFSLGWQSSIDGVSIKIPVVV